MLTLTSKDEDYLETIYRIAQKNDTVGVTDVAKARDVTVPTARSAVARLAKSGLVRQEHYGKIILKAVGRQRATEIYEAHKTLHRFLTEVLQVDERLAEKEACRMEHGLSKGTLQRLVMFLESLESCPGNKPQCGIEKYRKAVKMEKK